MQVPIDLHLGFTGTQVGCTVEQCLAVVTWLNSREFEVFHHGDCTGADSDVHVLASHCGLWTIAHPPINEAKRAFCVVNECLPPYKYLVRNRHIVESTSHLLVCPKGPEELRSGTWSTARYARKKEKPFTIIWPNGSRSTSF